VRVGYVGRLAPHKGVSVLLDAVAEQPELHLTLAGRGPAELGLRQRSVDLKITDRITWLGGVSQDELPGVYGSLDVLAVPSLTTAGWVEQFGRVAVEAMACGVPVIGSSSGAIPDVIGDAGLIVPEGDRAALAGALRGLMSDPDRRRDLAERGRARVLARYTQAQVAAQTVDVYRSMLRIPD